MATCETKNGDGTFLQHVLGHKRCEEAGGVGLFGDHPNQKRFQVTIVAEFTVMFNHILLGWGSKSEECNPTSRCRNLQLRPAAQFVQATF